MANKKELLSQLVNAQNNYLLGLAAISLFGNSQSYPLLDQSQCRFGSYSFDFVQVSSLLQNPRDREIALPEFLKMLMRGLVKESFELVKSYTKSTGQIQVFERQSWYHYARLIRNCISHDFKFQFKAKDKNLLPVSWRDRAITRAMDGTFLNLSEFGYVQAWELFSDIQALAVSVLV